MAPRNPTLRLLAIALCASILVTTASATTLLHRPAPPLVRTDLQGRQVDLSALKGRVVLLTFWATWCAPCQVEMPRFNDWQARYGPQGLQIVGVSMDDDDAPVRSLIAQREVSYPIVMGDAQLGRLYGGVMGLPVTFLIDRQGRIAARFKGETNLATLERTLRRLLNTR